MSDHDSETVSVEFRRATEKAICVREHEDAEDVWLPISMCSVEPHIAVLDPGDVVSVTAPEWLLSDRGLI